MEKFFKQNIMKTKIFLLTFFLSQIALSQTIEKSSIDNGGASVSNANIQIVYTIGEVNVQEVTAGNLSISEGFIGSDLMASNPYIIVPDVEILLDITEECEATPTAPTANNGYGDIFTATPDVTFPITTQGSTEILWTYDDGNGNTVTQTQNVIINNQVPVLSNLSVPLDPVTVNSSVSLSVDYDDNNLSEALIDWGDGFQTYGEIDTGVITADHMYTTPGVYILEIQVKDDCGETASLVYQYIVAYDPSGGFVTGGGWINSPAGAYTADPSLAGKANFGFVSKYKKGQTVPTGNTEFQFKAGDLNFKSSLFDWLVISGSKAKFKGEGTINGIGSYGFMISAIDEDSKEGKIDKFRIKIWDKANEEFIVYDNELDGLDDSDPTTEIAGGAIVVHSGKGKINDPATILSDDDLSSSEFIMYPNPFSNNAFIKLRLNESSNIIIDIYDLNGRLIENLYYGNIEKGVNYNFEFNPRISLKNGIYIVKFIMENGSVYTKKLIKK